MPIFLLVLTGIGLIGLAIALFAMRNHPKGLYILFFAEMWERFSYYGMRGLLVFYLTQHFLFEQSDAYGIYGAYTSLVYVLPVIGGFVADRYMGHRQAVVWGAVLLVAGHALMAIEGPPAASAAEVDGNYLNIFYLALALIIMGVGFLKGNISAIVGQLYPRTDAKRDGAFTLFYVGINLGSFFGAAYAGYLGQTYGWGYGFGLAGIGMLLGLIVFIFGKPLLNGAGELSGELAELAKSRGHMPTFLIALGTLALTVFVWWVVRDQEAVGLIFLIFGGATVLYIIFRSVLTLEPHARDRIFAAMFLISVQVLFWSLFEQAGSSLNVFADEQTDRTIFGEEIPASVFQSLNAGYIVFLGPLFAAMWTFLAKRNMEPTAPQKFGLGVIQLGLGFLVLVWGAGTGDALTPVIFIFLIYLLHTTGELFLSPVGLSAMTRLSVPSMVGLIMGTWFLASGFGNYVAAAIAQLTTVEGAEGESVVLQVYSNVGWLAVGVGVLLVLISPLINHLMHLKTLDDESTGLKKDSNRIAEGPIDQMP